MSFSHDASIYIKLYIMNNNELKNYLNLDNKSGYKTREKHIKNNFPDTYNEIINLNQNNDWFTNLYNYVNDINENKLCSQCGKVLSVRIFNLGYPQYCSTYCKNTNIKFKEKIKKSCQLKYGVDNPSKSEFVKDKIKNKLYKDGKWYNETDEFKKKSKQTCLKKYGVEHFSKTKEYHEKVKETSLNRYGVDSYSMTEEYRNDIKQRNMEKYGVEYYFQTKECTDKTKKTNIEKYGVDSYTKTDGYKAKMKKYYIDKYGVEYPMQIDEFKNKMVDTMIQKYGELWVKNAPKYNPNSIIYLDMISNKLGLHIQHALNGGEKKFVRYWVDGYIGEHNICIEWDEKHHNGLRQKERDKTKEIFIKENYHCKFIRINEKEFFKNIETNIYNICGLINNLIGIK